MEKRKTLTRICLSLVLLVASSTAEGRTIREGENFGRCGHPGWLGSGRCLVETWQSPTSLGNLGGCQKIVYMIDIQDNRPVFMRVGVSANIYLLSRSGLFRKHMATITIRQSGAGFYFDPKQYEDYVRWSNGQVRFVIELAPGDVRIRDTRCRYVFAR